MDEEVERRIKGDDWEIDRERVSDQLKSTDMRCLE